MLAHRLAAHISMPGTREFGMLFWVWVRGQGCEVRTFLFPGKKNPTGINLRHRERRCLRTEKRGRNAERRGGPPWMWKEEKRSLDQLFPEPQSRKINIKHNSKHTQI